MNEEEKLALIPGPRGKPEKVEPGAKRILSGMVADTLALVKTETPSRRNVHVLMAGGPEFNECFSFAVSEADDRLSACFHFCQRMDELVAALKQCKFDLALVQLHRTPAPELNFADKQEIQPRVDRLLAENEWLVWAGLETASLLESVYGIPVVLVSDTGNEEAEKPLASQVGARALFSWLKLETQEFFGCLRAILLQPHDASRKSNSFRIIIVDDESVNLELIEWVILNNFKDVIVETFQQGELAWKELMRADPDLLITDMNRDGLSGWEMLPLLAERKVKYPVFVISGFATEEQVRQCAGPNLRWTFLPKAWHAKDFLRELSIHLGPRRNSLQQVSNGEP